MGDFIKGFTAGANIEAQRQELALRRRAQEAQAALQERQWAQEAQMLRERSDALAAAMAQRKQTAVDAVVAQQMFAEKVKEFGGDQGKAMQAVIPPVALMNPQLGEQLAVAYKNLQSGNGAMGGGQLGGVKEIELPGGRKVSAVQTSPNKIQLVPEAMPEGGLQAQPVKDANGKVIQYAVPGANGPRFFSPKAGVGEATKAEIKSIYEQVDRLQGQFDEMWDNKPSLTSMGMVPNQAKIELGKRIEGLKEKARALEQGVPAAAADSAITSTTGAPDKFVVGKAYVDKNGNKAVYKGNGKWEPQ